MATVWTMAAVRRWARWRYDREESPHFNAFPDRRVLDFCGECVCAVKRVILRPGFIHGTRRVGSVKIPLGLVGSPMQMVLQSAKPLTRLPLVGPLLTPPVSVASVAKVAVRAATDPVFPPGIVDVYGIMRYSDQKLWAL
uniref:Uncharacterized protein n=1 Tax=Oryza meridionalis TaxID=40149 RepID=A0A0E0CLY7_9ORYZ